MPTPRPRATAARVKEALALLRKRGSATGRAGMKRYGITAPKAFGVGVGEIQKIARQFGRDHALALALWDTGWYEARMLTAYVDEVEQVTPAQMEKWVRDFDNWAICDTLCFCLWDRSPHAWKKVDAWCPKPAEFVRRSGFVLIASLALHEKSAPDAPFVKGLRHIETWGEAGDDRNLVKKGVSWALRSVGRRNAALLKAATKVAQRLAESEDAGARWVGRDALREFKRRRVARRA